MIFYRVTTLGGVTLRWHVLNFTPFVGFPDHALGTSVIRVFVQIQDVSPLGDERMGFVRWNWTEFIDTIVMVIYCQENPSP